MQIIACQFDIVWENKRANFAKVRALLSQGEVPAGSLIVLPEMFATGFSMNVGGIAEEVCGETQTFLTALAREWKSYVIGGVATLGSAGMGRNEAVVLNPLGEEIGRYYKQRPFTLAGEGEHYVPGDRHLLATCGEFTISPFICYDLRFPELFRPAVRDGAQVLAVIANWPQVRGEHWTALIRARAIENQSYVVGVNRTGIDPLHTYAGQSTIVDPQGTVIAAAGQEEQLLSCKLDLESLLQYRRKLPFLADMRL